MKLKTIKNIKNLKSKRVLVRCDFNVPVGKDGEVAESGSWKIERSLPTIKYLVSKKAKVFLISHLGQPKGKKDKKFSLWPVAEYLSKELKQAVIYLSDLLDGVTVECADGVETSQTVLFENIRFYPGEERNSNSFAKKLAEFADIYINDAFAVSHRKHASLVGVPKYLPSYAGFLVEEEVRELSQALSQPKEPLVVIMGGAKISTKILALENLLKKADSILLGGALVNNFLKVIGYPVGKSIIEKDYLKEALRLLNKKKLGSKIILPVDVLVGGGLVSPRRAVWHQLNDVEKDEYILDIGPRTRRLYSQLIKRAGTIIWNGPMGYFENKHFSRGTYKIARAVARSRARTIVGGGETVEVLKRLKLLSRIDFVSTGGGAMLEFLGGKELVGLKPLMKR